MTAGRRAGKRQNTVSKRVIVGSVVIGLAVILSLPLIFRTRPSPLAGPDLSELQYTEVSFQNGDWVLAGLLFLPEADRPFPVVVMIHGSGTSRRNHPWYLTVVQQLQDSGVAVLLPDKRGSEKSEGDWTGATFHDLATDATSAIAFVRDQARLEYSSIGVMGFSQGGWIAPIVASENEEVAFVVSMSGAGVTTDEQLLYEEVNNIADFTYRPIAGLIAPFTVKSIQKTRFWEKIGGFDPIPYWRRVDVPVFMAFGGKDRNVPLEESVRRLRGLDKSNVTIQVYPEAGHGIVDPATRRVRSDFLRDLIDFIEDSQIDSGEIALGMAHAVAPAPDGASE